MGLKHRENILAAMNVRVVLLASMLLFGGLVAVTPTAAAMCYLDPDDPLPGVQCGANSAVGCALAVVKKGTCAV